MTRTLPDTPSLEHLKKEAKALLRNHRQGDPAACAVLRQLHQFLDKSDAYILATPVKLTEMQFALALEYGFKSWQVLKQHVADSRPPAEATVPPDEPLYISPAAAKSLYQEYRIYADRVELDSKLALGKIVIFSRDLLELDIRPPLVLADLFRGGSLAQAFPLKIDSADGHRHVALKRRSGFIKHIRFTPDDPDKFVEICRGLMNKQGGAE